MRNIWTICRRELYAYFVSPIAWVLLALFAVLSGGFTFVSSSLFVQETMASQMRGQAVPMSVNELVIAPLFGNLSVVGLFLIPLISMRLFAEEKRQGTIELLVTSPVSDAEIIGGKWLAAVLMYAALMVVLAFDLSFLFIYGSPDLKPVLSGFLGMILQGAGLLAFGAFISSLTKNQIVAGAVGFGFALLLLILSWWSSLGDSTPIRVLGYISFVNHMESFERGVIDTKDLIYYLSMIFLGLFLTARSLESLRWRA
jgi:ABC-2 type transport system permease protein